MRLLITTEKTLLGIFLGLILLISIAFLIRFIIKEYILDASASTGSRIAGVIGIIVIISLFVFIGGFLLALSGGGFAPH